MPAGVAGHNGSADSSPAETNREGKQAQRLLACAPCQKRKLKCSRQFPCANCIKTATECIPGTLAQRRRRFPEQALLQRLRHYEQLLRDNHVAFEPLHGNPTTQSGKPGSGKPSPSSAGQDHSDENDGEADEGRWAQDNSQFYHAMTEAFDHVDINGHDEDSELSADDLGPPEPGLKKAIHAVFNKASSSSFFPATQSQFTDDMSAAHPTPVQIFRLWNIFAANVNPLLKVTHTSTLQDRIVDATGGIGRKKIDPNLEALMFSIYAMAVTSLDEKECEEVLDGVGQEDALRSYQNSCWQALLNTDFLRTSNRDCMTALFLYLLSCMGLRDPTSMSSMIGLAVRIARQMGLHNETTCSRFPPFEAEMRRRLWWSLVLLDARVVELTCQRPDVILPGGGDWDCREPLDVNDHDLRPDMKEPPRARTPGSRCTDAVFLVIRCKLAAYMRSRSYYGLRKGLSSAGDDYPSAVALEKGIEEEYLQFCDPGIAAHFATMYMARTHLSKLRLMEEYNHNKGSSTRQRPTNSSSPSTPESRSSDVDSNQAISEAMKMLKADTTLLSTPSQSKGFLWFARFQFPAPAYIHLAQELRARPTSEHADPAWDALSENYEVRWGRFGPIQRKDLPPPSSTGRRLGAGLATRPVPGQNQLFRAMATMIMRAWEPREEAIKAGGMLDVPVPSIVTRFREGLQDIMMVSGKTLDGVFVRTEAGGGENQEEAQPTGLAQPDDGSLPWEPFAPDSRGALFPFLGHGGGHTGISVGPMVPENGMASFGFGGLGPPSMNSQIPGGIPGGPFQGWPNTAGMDWMYLDLTWPDESGRVHTFGSSPAQGSWS